jgi:hypothetical protein
MEIINKMKRQKGFIQIPLLIAIIAGVLVLTGGGYLGVKQYQNYQIKQVEEKRLIQEADKVRQEKEKQAQDLIIAQQKAIEENKREIEKIRKEVESKKQNPASNNYDLASIIKKWRPRVVNIECDWKNFDTGRKHITVGGSGFLMKLSGGLITIITNKHVLQDSRDPITTSDFYIVNSCNIRFPETGEIYFVPTSDMSFSVEGGADWGSLNIKRPNTYINNLVSSNLPVCEQKPSIGDQVVVLGYPGIGSQNDITATDGIISGYDNEYFITSAKIEQGNSGGIAVLVKNNCYLGLPTFAQVGGIESLARILDIHSVLSRTPR